ncbi:site-specific DNA-methyltransferase, partial [Bacillus thuringiensis]|nr:site-specific DNA-methyltransferase [Bacillus thuringiensis]
SFDFENIAKELYRVTKQCGIVVWIVGDRTSNGSETGTSFKQALYFKEIGFNLHDTMIYEKDSISFPDSNRYYQIFEYMFVFSKGKP